jgi:hypothetical protein
MGRPWPKNGLSSTEEDKTNNEIINLIPKWALLLLLLQLFLLLLLLIHSSIHSFSSLSYNRFVASSKKVLHRLRSSAPSFNFQYPLISSRPSSSCLRHLLRLPITSILLSIFPTTQSFRRQFLCKTWPIQFAFLLVVCMTFPSSLTHCNLSSLLTRSSQLIFFTLLQHQISNVPGISHLLSDVSKF